MQKKSQTNNKNISKLVTDTIRKPHIVILIPAYKRPDIVQICIEGLKLLIAKTTFIRFSIVFLISPEDPDFETLKKIIPDEWLIIAYKNQPLGEKMNAGIEFIMKHFKKFDYLMNFGSDNIIHPHVMNIFWPYIQQKTPMFGLSNIYIHEYETRETLFLARYVSKIPYGLARMIHFDILEYLRTNELELYPDRLNSGLDTNSFKTMVKIPGFHYDMIVTGQLPLTIDIKSNTNINHWLTLVNIADPEKKFVDLQTTSNYFHEIIQKFRNKNRSHKIKQLENQN